MPFTIHTEPIKPRLVTMGQADKIISPEPVEKTMAAAVPIPVEPPESKKSNIGRPKKMAKEKDLSEVGTKTIRQDDPGEQGAIGSHGQNAPAQTKVPQSDEDKEAQSNG